MKTRNGIPIGILLKQGLGGVLKGSVQVLIGWGAVLADGPLPFGDILGGVAILDGITDITVNGSLMGNGLLGGNAEGVDGPVDVLDLTVDAITGSDEAGDAAQGIADTVFEGSGG